MVSIVSESSEPSVKVATNADIAEEGINVPTILLLSSSLRRTTCTPELDPLRLPSWVKTASTLFHTVSTDPARTL